MANIKSAKKRNITNEKARLKNISYRSEIKTYTKKVLEALAANDFEGARTSLSKAESLIAKSVHKGIMKKNTASRKISRLAHRVKAENQAHTTAA